MAGTNSSLKNAYLVAAVFLVIAIAELVVGIHREGVWSRERDGLAAKAAKFDAFCDQQRVFIGVLRDQLQSGPSSLTDSSIEGFRNVFVELLGQRDLLACLGSAKWDHERAAGCVAQRDQKCLIEIANHAIELLHVAADNAK